MGKRPHAVLRPKAGRHSVRFNIAFGDPLLPAPCILCGRRFEPEGYPAGFRTPELIPGVPIAGFAPGFYEEGGGFAGFVCPACCGDGEEDLGKSALKGAKRLRRIAEALERGGA